MARLYLVRHGEAVSAWDRAPDPGLSAAGAEQARGAAAELAPLAPFDLVSSPMRRARETVAAFESRFGLDARIEDRVTEVPSPTGESDQGSDRRAWLDGFLAGRWSEQAPEILGWRAELRAALQEITRPTVVVSHFVAVNALVALASGRDRVLCFRPANCSVTVFDAGADGFRLVTLGREMATRIG